MQRELWKGRKVLITGAAGFLGTNLTLRLAGRGAWLTLVDNFSRRGVEGNRAMIEENFPHLSFLSAEIADVPAIIAREKPDLVYHFAAQVAVTTSVVSPVSDFRINGEGTFNVARAAGEHDIPVIYSSTNKVYGNNVNDVPLRELPTRYDFDGELKERGIGENFSIDARHHTPYGCSKLVGELYVREWGGVVNRCSCMYGPNQHGIVDQGWVSYFISRKVSGLPVTIFGDGKQVRDLLYADDVVGLLERQGEFLLDKTKPDIRGEVFAVGGGYQNTVSLLELCDMLGIEPSFGPWRPADQKVFYADISKAKRILGWEPKVSAKEGVELLYKWQQFAKVGAPAR